MITEAFNCIVNNVNGPLYLEDGQPAANLKHLASLKSTNRDRSALLADSLLLAEKGSPRAPGVISASGSILKWGVSAVAACVAAQAWRIAETERVFTQHDEIFCIREVGRKIFTNSWRTVEETAARFNWADATSSVENLKLNAWMQEKEVELYSGYCDNHPLLFKILYCFTESVNILRAHPFETLAITGSVALLGAFVSYQRRITSQREARKQLVKSLHDCYFQMAQTFKNGREEADNKRDTEALEKWCLIGQEIHNNRSLIQRDLAKCLETLSLQKQDSILNTLIEALPKVV